MPADTGPDRRGPAIGDRQVTAGLMAGVVPAPNLVRRNHSEAVYAGVLTSLLGVGGVWAGMLGMFGSGPAIGIGRRLPVSGVELCSDALDGRFMRLTGPVAVVAGLYTAGNAGRENVD